MTLGRNRRLMRDLLTSPSLLVASVADISPEDYVEYASPIRIAIITP